MAGNTRTRRDDAIVDPQDIAQLARGFGGELVSPHDPIYEQARKVWNEMVDKRPALIAFCSGPRDVIQSIDFARSLNLPLSVRAGGHNVAGSAVCHRGLVIDLSPMNAVSIDPKRRIARVQAGLRLGDIDAATQGFGLATTMGVNSDTGVAGLTLGGGFGKLGRKHGLACDNLLGAEIVTADGRLVNTSPSENAAAVAISASPRGSSSLFTPSVRRCCARL
jgi:FAD/FMN-containing dehydrogenase